MKVIFYLAKRYSIPIVLPLIEYAQKNGIDFAFYLSDKVKKVITQKYENVKIFGNTKEAKNFKPDFVIVPGNFVNPFISGIKVQIFHGLGIEKSSHYKIRHFFDLYCTSGPVVTNRFLKLKEEYKYFDVVETGWPKIDHILKYPKNDLKEKFDIPPDKKVILYAPTHSKKMQSAMELLPIIPKIIKKDEIWFVKFHELMDREQKEAFKKAVSGNVRFITDYDITPYLHLSNLLISDTSSVIYEFMVLNKPVITYKTIDRKDKGINVCSQDKLRDAIDESLSFPMKYSENRKRHLSEINPYLDGKTADRIFNALYNFKKPKRRKPLNLFRKMQILYHENFKKGYLR